MISIKDFRTKEEYNTYTRKVIEAIIVGFNSQDFSVGYYREDRIFEASLLNNNFLLKYNFNLSTIEVEDKLNNFTFTIQNKIRTRYNSLDAFDESVKSVLEQYYQENSSQYNPSFNSEEDFSSFFNALDNFCGECFYNSYIGEEEVKIENIKEGYLFDISLSKELSSENFENLCKQLYNGLIDGVLNGDINLNVSLNGSQIIVPVDFVLNGVVRTCNIFSPFQTGSENVEVTFYFSDLIHFKTEIDIEVGKEIENVFELRKNNVNVSQVLENIENLLNNA